MTTLQDLTTKLRAAVAVHPAIDKSIKLDLNEAGIVVIAGGTVSNEDGPADLTLTMSMASLLALSAGKLDPTFALVVGKIKCSDVKLLLALQDQIREVIGDIDLA
jgi:putative sterol carrier protein